jgi:dephospho-CoA kinase
MGLAGGIACGKTTVCNLLREWGFEVISLSDFVADSMVRLPTATVRADYFDAANSMREALGDSILAEKAIAEILNLGIAQFVVDGIRRVEEVHALRTAFDDFLLVGVHASLEERLRRIALRGRDIDPTERDAALRLIMREEDDGEHGCQLRAVMALCDSWINGDLPVAQLKSEIPSLLQLSSDPR